MEAYIPKMRLLAKWRSVFAGWQLGTRSREDPECNAVKDHRELTIMLRAEVSALIELLIKKEVFTEEEFQVQAMKEADHLCAAYEKLFPGFKATPTGMHMDVQVAKETMKGWRP